EFLARLRESEARYRALADATLESVAIHEGGRIVEVNQATERLYGYARAELIGMMVWDLVVPARRAEGRANVEEGSDQPREYLALRKDGTTVPIQVTSRSCSYQGRSARVVVTRDMTEQRQREAAVRASEERFRVVARATNDAIWEMDMATQEFVR